MSIKGKKNGEVKDDMVGKTYLNSEGYVMTIVEYFGCNDLTIEFNDYRKTRIKSTTKHLSDGMIKNPYDKSVYGIAYIGNTKNIDRRSYKTWNDMLKRCYVIYNDKKDITYRDCEVCEEWLNYTNFKNWYDENYYKIDGEIMNLDKDIILKGNKIYSPNACVFVPKGINGLFTKRNLDRGEYPIGVHKSKNYFSVEVSTCIREKSRKRITKSGFNNTNDAFLFYKQEKEKYIKRVADMYKKEIPQKLYDAMYSYQVERTD